jgi:hypothetical protein
MQAGERVKDETTLRRWCVEQATFIHKNQNTVNTQAVLDDAQKLYEWVIKTDAQ